MVKGKKGWHGEPQRHKLAAMGIKTANKKNYKAHKVSNSDKFSYPSIDGAWHNLVHKDPVEFMEDIDEPTIEKAVDKYIDDNLIKDELDIKTTRKQLIQYLKKNLGSKKLQNMVNVAMPYAPDQDDNKSTWEACKEWTKITRQYHANSMYSETFPTEDDVINYMNSRVFKPKTALHLYKSGITPEMAHIRPLGTGRYIGEMVESKEITAYDAKKIIKNHQ